MITASELAGYFAAHAIWCVSDGDDLVPMLAHVGENGTRRMTRLANDDAEAAVDMGRRQLDENEMDANDAALLFDGRITVEGEKIDAILVEVRAYFSPESEVVIAVPYSPRSAGPFRVHRPRLLVWKDCGDFDRKAVFQAFFRGVDTHDQGGPIWNAALDRSR
jgi:hypothetical protein